MTTEDLEIAILELIERIYCAKYTGYIKVQELRDPYEQDILMGYKLVLGLNVKEKPLTLAADGTPKLFLKYIAQELKFKRLDITEYSTGYQVDPDN